MRRNFGVVVPVERRGLFKAGARFHWLRTPQGFPCAASGTAFRVSTEIQCTVPISNFVAPNLKVEVAIDTPEATD